MCVFLFSRKHTVLDNFLQTGNMYVNSAENIKFEPLLLLIIWTKKRAFLNWKQFFSFT